MFVDVGDERKEMTEVAVFDELGGVERNGVWEDVVENQHATIPHLPSGMEGVFERKIGRERRSGWGRRRGGVRKAAGVEGVRRNEVGLVELKRRRGCECNDFAQESGGL